jgi:hypothetical protein
MTTRTLVLAAALAVLAASPAIAGMCDQPPFSLTPQSYEILTSLFGEENMHDLLGNVCRAKYTHDAKKREALHEIGISNAEIDNNDVGYVAVKVLEAYARTLQKPKP